MNKNKILSLGFALLMLTVVSCSSTTKVTRVDVNKTIDLSGRWNDSDARMVSEEMIKNCLANNWLDNFMKANGRNPTVIVGTVLNRSSEHIDPLVFIKDLESNLINSGKVTFVANKDERVEVRDERDDQKKGFTDPTTVRPFGKETGADFMLKGTINSVTDELKNKSTTLYQVNLELINLTNNHVEWLGKKELKKYVEKSKYSL